MSKLIAWVVVGLIAFVTLSPVGLRPDFGHVNVERFAGFAIAGVLFGLAYPRHLLRVGVALVGAALLLESLQFLMPGRDPALANFLLKGAGAAAGVSLAAMVVAIRNKLKR